MKKGKLSYSGMLSGNI